MPRVPVVPGLRPVVVVTALVALSLGVTGCATSRLESYSSPEAAPDLRQSPLLSVQVLHHKQTQRDLQAWIRVTNNTRLPLHWTRTGPGAARFTLHVQGHDYEALPPRAVTWSPYALGVQRGDQTQPVELQPGEFSDLDLRWEVPSAIGDYEYPWDLMIDGLLIDVSPCPNMTVHWPPAAPDEPR